MCFDNDCDWTPSNWYEDEGPADAPCRCDECGLEIATGDWRFWYHAVEYDYCVTCDDSRDDDNDDEPECKCESPDYGEEFEYQRCQACDKLLRAIEAQETDEGCPPHARRPNLTELSEVFTEHQQGFDYAQRAVDMFPELYQHKFITRLLTK